MGMDGVLIVMDVEEHFGITIRDEEATSIQRVCELVELVQSRILATRQFPCVTLTAFYKIRNAVESVAPNGSRNVRPSRDICSVLTPVQRIRLWNDISDHFDLTLPPLRTSRIVWLVSTAAYLLIACVMVGVAIELHFSAIPIAIFLSILPATLISRSTRPYRTFPPSSLHTFGLLTKKIAGSLAATRMLNIRSAKDILEELRPIIAGNLGIDASQIQIESRFVEDLGMD